MIAVLLYSLLFLFGIICTFISPTKKFLSLRSQSSPNPNTSAPAAAVEIDCSVSRRVETTAVESDCSSSSGNRRAELRNVFATFDKNDDGHITKQELRESLRNIGIAAGEGDVEDMVRKVDANGDGLIDFDEFCRLFSGAVEELDDACDGDGGLKEAFDVFDGNKDGLITVEELGLVLSSLGFTEGKKLDDCREMIMKVDMDGDGMVNFDEFKKMMKSGFGRLIQVS